MCGLTDNDLFAEMRQYGWFGLHDVAFVRYDARGGITVLDDCTVRFAPFASTPHVS